MRYDEDYLDNERSYDEPCEVEDFDDEAEERHKDLLYDREHGIDEEEEHYNKPCEDRTINSKFIILHWVEPVNERAYLTDKMTSSSRISDAKKFNDRLSAQKFLYVYLKNHQYTSSSYWKIDKYDSNDVLAEALAMMGGSHA